MRILFFGIYELGLRALGALLASGREVVAAVTKPETDADRQPVAARARERGIPLFTPKSPREESFLCQAKLLSPDLVVVAGYHRIIPKDILDLPRLGAINLHGSLLPQYRGPCPWKLAVANGETEFGVTVHAMTPELDNGDILLQRAFAIGENDTGGMVFAKVCRHGPAVLLEALERIGRGEAVRTPQDESRASYYGYPTIETTRIDWQVSAQRIRNLVRGMNPRPGAWTSRGGGGLRVLKAALTGEPSTARPGQVVAGGPRPLVATGTFDLRLEEWSADDGAAALEAGERLI